MHGGSNRTAEYILHILIFWIKYAIQLYRAVTSLAIRQCCLLAVASWSSLGGQRRVSSVLLLHCSTACRLVKDLVTTAPIGRSRAGSSLSILELPQHFDCFKLPLLPVTTTLTLAASPPPKCRTIAMAALKTLKLVNRCMHAPCSIFPIANGAPLTCHSAQETP